MHPPAAHHWVHHCALLLTLVVGCGSGVGPDSGSPYIDFISGVGGSDTIETQRSQLLVVLVKGLDGNPAQGSIVRFDALPIPGAGSGQVYPSRADQRTYQPTVFDTTDAQGHARVKVQLGTKAGVAKLLVTIAARTLSDTARFTVLPGAATALRFQPQDTAVYVGNSVQLRSVVVDRVDNPRVDPVTYALASGPAAVTTGGRVTGNAIGAVRIAATSGAVGYAGGVSVVPAGSLAAIRLVGLGSVVVFNLDGTGYTELKEVGGGGFDRSPVWAPDGAEIVFSNGDYAPMRLSTINPAGDLRRLIANPPVGVLEEVYPEFSHDGAWIYFNDHGQAGGVWRVHPDGSGAVRVSPDTGSLEGQWWPSPSPDGTQYSFFSSNDAGLRTFTIADSSVSSWIAAGGLSRWSPLGDVIAYMSGSEGTVRLISPTGSGDRAISPANRLYNQNSLTWSPDGVWLAVRGPTTLEILNTQTGLTLPLGFTANFFQPAWKP